MELENPEEALERLEKAQEALEEIVSAACDLDEMNYFAFLKTRARASDGRFYLALVWYGTKPPPASAVYAPPGYWMSSWYRAQRADGTIVWESCLELGS